MPEPDFFIFFVVSGVIASVAASVAGVLFCIGIYRESKPLKVIAAWILGLGLAAFAPMAFLLFLWIRYWAHGAG